MTGKSPSGIQCSTYDVQCIPAVSVQRPLHCTQFFFFNATVSAQSALSVLSNTVVLLFDSKYGHKTHKFVPVYHKYFEGIFCILGNRRDDPYCSHVCEINM